MNNYYKTDQNEFQQAQNKKQQQLKDEISIQKMSIKILEEKINNQHKIIIALKMQLKKAKFTDEHVWLQTWLKCCTKIDSDQALIWADRAVKEYNKKFTDKNKE